MEHHQIRLYPFDTEENDEEEVQLNNRIRVRCISPQPANIAGYDPFRRHWLGAQRRDRRQARQRSQEQVGSYQC